MAVTVLHREDIKAELRKRHGTVTAFADCRGLKRQAVADWLRGRTSASVARAVAKELGLTNVRHEDVQSINVDNTRNAVRPHRLNAEAR